MNNPMIDQNLVQKLIVEQFPQWSKSIIKPVDKSGWDNRTFHLGDELLIRLPSKACYANQVAKEQQWLPKLAPHLPLFIPTPVALGKPSHDFPWPWSVYEWIEGEAASLDTITDLSNFAKQLAKFLKTLQRCDTEGAPVASGDNFYRGGDLKVYDEPTSRGLKIE